MGLSKVPQMRELRERFIQLCLDCHPDKGGSDKKFQDLLEARDQISKFIIDNVPVDKGDLVETLGGRSLRSST